MSGNPDRQEAPFVFPGGLNRVDYAAFLSQHDVVYQAPPVEGIDGLPVGNGDLGAILWTPPDRLMLNINKVDLWDDGPDGPFGGWEDSSEETGTVLRSAGALSISNGLPAYDRLYLENYEGRLRLAEAEVSCQSATPFARVQARAFVSEASRALVVEYQDQTGEAVPRRIELSRWATRSLFHWYSRIPLDTDLLPGETQSGCDGKRLWITQRLRGLHFAVAARVEGPGRPGRLHSRLAFFESPPLQTFRAVVYLAVVHSEEAADPLAKACQIVDEAARQGLPAVEAEHRRSWLGFWQASFIDLPPDQDYVENLWYLNSYHMGSCCKGRFPPNHIHGLWGWNRDVFPWAYYYHWNEQLHVYSLHASGHPELALPHLRYRRAMLDQAVADARRVHGRAGAFYTDVANRKGYQDTGSGTDQNLTPGPQIAAQFWQHYQYTLDESFLDEMAYPMIREVATFYLETLVRREDGCLTFYGTQPYEGVLLLRDTLTDLAHARQVFRIFLEASRLQNRDEDLAARISDALDRLAPYVTLPVSSEYAIPEPPADMPGWNGDAAPVGFKPLQPGDPTMPMWHLGYKVPGSSSPHGHNLPDGLPVHEGMRDPRTHRWIFTSTNIAPVFPANQVGLDQAGTAEFEAAANTLKALGQDSQSFSLYMVSRARLGMAEELQASLARWPERFQIFPQGFMHYFARGHSQLADDGPRKLKEVRVAGRPGQTVHWPMSLSNHMSLEGGPVLQLAVNEMLLQSYSGTIRIFPAAPAGWEGRFRLHAAGSFIVSAARQAGEAAYVVVESKAGRPCRLANPWPGKKVNLFLWREGWVDPRELDGKILEFDTEKAQVTLLLPAGRLPGRLATWTGTGAQNQGSKTLGAARLGLPKGF